MRVEAEADKLGVVAIEGDGDLAAACDEIERVLYAEKAPIYRRGGMLVRVVTDLGARPGIRRDLEAPRIVPFDDVSLADFVTRRIEVYRRNRKTGELVRSDCPRSIAQTLLARREWCFDPLETVVEHPVLKASGEVLWEPGYDPSTGLLLSFPHGRFQAPIAVPDLYDAAAALADLCGLLGGFDFVDDTDMAVALAFLFTAFVRPMLDTAPAFAIVAPTAGSGKTTLVRLSSLLSTGREPAFLTLRDDPGELQKMLFASLLEGDQSIAIDNIVGQVDNADLAVILTSPVYRARVLGQSSNASVPTKAVISLNGNNLQVVGDLTRRVLVCRLDPHCERPAERAFQCDPILEVRQLRSEHVLNALTIMGAYIGCGERVELRPFGSFDAWSRLVREPLVWLGLPDPIDSIRTLEAADPERTQLQGMLHAVSDAVGEREFKAAELLAMTKATRQQSLDGAPAIGDEQAQSLSEALTAVCERNGELNVKALGRWLLKVQGRIHDGMCFVQGRQTRVGATWKVRRG